MKTWSLYHITRSRKKVLLKLVQYDTFSCLWLSCFLDLSWYFICYLMFHSLRSGDSHHLRADIHRHLRSYSITCQVLKQHPATGIPLLPPKHMAQTGGRGSFSLFYRPTFPAHSAQLMPSRSQRLHQMCSFPGWEQPK